ncbi:MAG: hypothetical protein AAGA29_10935 [Planctomycetota bacterium]
MKRLAWSAVFVVVVAGIGAVGGVLYPYKELLYNQDLRQLRRERHIETAMTDNRDRVEARAAKGAIYLGGLTTLVLVIITIRKDAERKKNGQ